MRVAQSDAITLVSFFDGATNLHGGLISGVAVLDLQKTVVQPMNWQVGHEIRETLVPKDRSTVAEVRLYPFGDELPNGCITVRFEAAEIRYAEIAINGNSRIVREGEILELQPTDRIKLIRVVSTVQDQRSLRLQFRRKAEDLAELHREGFDEVVDLNQRQVIPAAIEFRHGTRIVGIIPLKVLRQ